VQFNRGVFMAPWGKLENWTLSVQHSEADVRRYVENLEFLGRALTA
jgi:glutamate-1-semialdehyde 2,1-aminomutase